MSRKIYAPFPGSATWSASENSVWLAAVFDSEETAHLAFSLDNATLERLQNAANEANGGFDGVVTSAMIDAALK